MHVKETVGLAALFAREKDRCLAAAFLLPAVGRNADIVRVQAKRAAVPVMVVAEYSRRAGIDTASHA